MTDLTHVEQIITRALLEGCDNHKTRAKIARETARRVMEAAQISRLLVPPNADMVRIWDKHVCVLYVPDETEVGAEIASSKKARIASIIRDYSHKPYSVQASQNAADAILRALSDHQCPSYEDGVKEGLRRAASKATSFLVGDPANGVPLRSPMAHEVAAAILSLLPKEEGK